MHATLLKHIQLYVQSLGQSLTNLDFYVAVLNTSLFQSIRYVLFFYLLMGILITSYLTVFRLPSIQTQMDEARQEFLAYLPNDVLATWEDERLQLVHPENPATVYYPSSFTKPDSFPAHIAVIDTSTSDAPDQQPALFYINDRTLYSNTLGGEWSEFSLTEVLGSDPLTIDRQVIEQTTQDISEMIDSLLTTLPILLLPAITLGLFISRVLFVALYSFIFQLVFSLMGKPVPYTKVFQLSLHTLIPVEIINQLTVLLNPEIPFSMVTISYWIIMSVIIWHMRNLQVLQFEKKSDKEK